MTSLELEPIETFAARYKVRLVNAELKRSYIVGEIREATRGAWWAQTLPKQERIGPFLTADEAVRELLGSHTTELLGATVRAMQDLERWQELVGDIVVREEVTP